MVGLLTRGVKSVLGQTETKGEELGRMQARDEEELAPSPRG